MFWEKLINCCLLFVTAVLWGVTNVLIKQGSGGINTVKADKWIQQVLLEIKFLFLNLKVCLQIDSKKTINKNCYLFTEFSVFSAISRKPSRISALRLCSPKKQLVNCCHFYEFLDTFDNFTHLNSHREKSDQL